MAATSIIGLQWGDEAKGKLCDILTSQHDIVVRFLGGANAGHTVVAGDRTYKLHHIPSGVLSPGIMNVVSAGVVINPPTLLKEIEGLASQGVEINAKNLLLSDRAHVVFPWHVAEDKILNSSTADGENIGTTLRGIGPCYRDKVGRSHAVRLGDLYRDNFKQTIQRIVAAKTKILAGLDSAGPLDAEQIYKEYAGYAERLKSLVGDSNTLLLDAVDQGKRLLFEGAQGSLLDVDHGTYPFVTSSNSSGVGVAAGSGVPARYITRAIGVVKAYSTRVGGGPMPTELLDDTGEHIRVRGKEYGTTTGRPRRCGWFDAVAVRYTARLSGVDQLSVMMLDVLSSLAEIQVCTAYELKGQKINHFPSHVDDLRNVKPVYETLPGWQKEITTARKLTDLPDNARRYLDRVSQLVGRPIGVVSIGPDRAQTIFV